MFGIVHCKAYGSVLRVDSCEESKLMRYHSLFLGPHHTIIQFCSVQNGSTVGADEIINVPAGDAGIIL